MKLLITGSSGFLGKLIYNNAVNYHHVKSVGRRNDDIYIRDLSRKNLNIKGLYDQVIHIAGKAHSIPKTDFDKQVFYDVNFRGTKNLLHSLSAHPPNHFIFISTVAVYGQESGEKIRESAHLQGTSPYSESKILAENAVKDWSKRYGVPALILRLPLIAGPNPPGNLGKMIAGIQKGRYLNIGGGKARRSVVLAEDVARCILDNYEKSGTYNLTDGYHPSFRELERLIAGQLNKPMPRSIPGGLARLIGRAGDLIPGAPVNTDTIQKMTCDLTFDDSKARRELSWAPRRVIDHFKIA